MDFKQSKTFANLAKAFAGESQARNRYTYYAEVAKKEGLEHVAAVFEETAWNERAHAQVFYNHIVENLGEGIIEVNATYPASIADTAKNLKAAADGEREEWDVLYKSFKEDALAEGYKLVAHSFKEIAEIEEQHESRYLALWNLVKEGKYFEREEAVLWKCMNCGYVTENKKAPLVCPACKYPQAHFELKEAAQ
ncbi:MAG: rubrerythrin family protein [Clostridiaceae bacterium]